MPNAREPDADTRRCRILLTDHPWPECDVEHAVAAAAGFELIVGPSEAGDDEAIQKLVAATQPSAILTCWAPVSGAAMAMAPELRIVARMGVGLDNIDIATATSRGILVTNVPDYCVEEVSDHAVALILSHLRGTVALDREVKSGVWNPGGAQVARLQALTVGLVGLGRISRATVRKLAGFGCQILASDPMAPDAPAGVELVELAILQAQADIIVLHLPLLAATHHLVDDDFIAACGKRPLLVNVSRGGLVDNAALLRGLEGGKISAAALDVVEDEPSPPAWLVGRLDVIVTPHVAFLSPASLLELRQRSAEEAVRVLIGAPPHFPCNAPAVGGTPLEGGVSSHIQMVDTARGRIVVKQALPKLRVAADWKSDPARSGVEVAALRTIAALLGPGTVPRVLWADQQRHCFGMELIEPRFHNWKLDLMAGKSNLVTAAAVGRLLGQLHTSSATRPDLAETFSDQRFFEELRIEPYFRSIAQRHPTLAPHIEAAIDGMRTSSQRALVHGDFSPKNLLVDGNEVVIVDCEVTHWGDPRFDLAFLLSHLLLKAMRRGGDRGQMLAVTRSVLDAYAATGPAIVDARLSQLTGALLLARIDGDSPVDYLVDLDLEAARHIASQAITHPTATPDSIFSNIEDL